ncbi:hypothetical protein GF415_03600 [Candidatus Micrarchaeota archaeon]|nr:hypothetical protein [Candidatus Micrarchaeota archaeon]
MSIQNWSGEGNNGNSDVYQGTANVNVTIYSYGAFLYAEGLTEDQKGQVTANPEVLSIENIGEEGEEVLRITLRDSSKTREVYSGLKNLGIGTMAVAQIGLPEKYTVSLENGTQMEIHGGYTQMLMEPLMKTGREISYVLVVQTDGSSTYGVVEARSYSSEVELEGETEIVSANASAYLFTIAWENRTLDTSALKSDYGEGNVTYNQKDYITFDPPLSAEETVLYKASYVTYISSASASVLANFTNRSRAEADFAGKAVFPDSVLQVNAAAPPNLSFEQEQVKTYRVSFPEKIEGYVLEAEELDIPSELDFSKGENATVVFNATVTGNMILGIKEIHLVKN